MADVRFVEVTDDLVEQVATDMREADRIEVMAAAGHTPIDALKSGVKMSQYTSAVIIDNHVVAVMGLVLPTTISNWGVPWMLGTNRLFRHPRVLIRWGHIVVSEMMDKVDVLQNYVHVENTRSMRWLHHLGFEFAEHVPIGRNGEVFARFFMEKHNV